MIIMYFLLDTSLLKNKSFLLETEAKFTLEVCGELIHSLTKGKDKVNTLIRTLI